MAMSARGASRDYRGSNRRATRVVLEARANGQAAPVQLYDVSVTGCRIDCSALELFGYDSIALQFAETITVMGEIAWRLGDIAGVRFTDPLPEAIARHFRQ